MSQQWSHNIEAQPHNLNMWGYLATDIHLLVGCSSNPSFWSCAGLLGFKTLLGHKTPNSYSSATVTNVAQIHFTASPHVWHAFIQTNVYQKGVHKRNIIRHRSQILHYTTDVGVPSRPEIWMKLTMSGKWYCSQDKQPIAVAALEWAMLLPLSAVESLEITLSIDTFMLVHMLWTSNST